VASVRFFPADGCHKDVHDIVDRLKDAFGDRLCVSRQAGRRAVLTRAMNKQREKERGLAAWTDDEIQSLRTKAEESYWLSLRLSDQRFSGGAVIVLIPGQDIVAVVLNVLPGERQAMQELLQRFGEAIGYECSGCESLWSD